jgi:hypothetical protein
MRILLPNNIYAKMFFSAIPGVKEEELIYTGSASISNELADGRGDIALIPSLDLLNHPYFFVSGKAAVSFDGALSNSYYYFLKHLRLVKEVYLKGDVSKNDVILTKIIFTEQFDSAVEVFLDSKPFELNSRNYLVCGDDNFVGSIYEAGLSLSDQISDMLDAPYVNYVLAATDESVLKEFTSGFSSLDKQLEDNFDTISTGLNYHQSIKADLKENLADLFFDMTEAEKQALTDLTRLPYFTGITEEIVEIKFVD